MTIFNIIQLHVHVIYIYYIYIYYCIQIIHIAVCTCIYTCKLADLMVRILSVMFTFLAEAAADYREARAGDCSHSEGGAQISGCGRKLCCEPARC